MSIANFEIYLSQLDNQYINTGRNIWSDAIKYDLHESALNKITTEFSYIPKSEIIDIYLPISQLISLYYKEWAIRRKLISNLIKVTDLTQTPFIIGLAGSVSAGKTTTASLLKNLIELWEYSPTVQIISTDNFLYPNKILIERDILNKKGFPVSYDLRNLISFLANLRAGKRNLKVPIYSHVVYDIIPDEYIIIDKPDIIILEGLNILQGENIKSQTHHTHYVYDYLDLTIYLDANESDLQKWYLDRFNKLRKEGMNNPSSFYYKYKDVPDDKAISIAQNTWKTINLVNLKEHIEPTKERADLIITKDSNHKIKNIRIKK